MANGVTHVQVQAQIHFDDGFTITLSSPLWHKDIRHGDYFKDEEICDIFTNVGMHMAEIVEEKTTERMHAEVKQKKDNEGRPTYWRKANPDEPFSLN